VAAGLAAFPDGSCALNGSSTGTAVLGEGEPGETRFGTLAFIGRYDADGRLRWARGAGNTVFRGVAALPGGALATTLSVQGSVTLNGGLPDARTFVAVGTIDGLLVRYEEDGRLGWATRAGGPSAYVTLTDCASHADGSVAVVCAAYGTVTFGAGEPGETTFPGSAYVFSYVALARYAPDGALRWARRTRNDGGSQYFGDLRVAAVPEGGVAISGGFSRATTFGPGEPGETTLPGDAISLGVGFVARYAPDGALRWARQIGTAGFIYVTAIASSPAGEVVVAGYSGMPITFGEGGPSETTMVPAPIDLYFARYGEGDGRFLGVVRFTFADAWWGSSGSRSALVFDAEVSSFPDGSLVIAATGGLTGMFAPGTPAERTFAAIGGADVALAVLDRATLDAISE
jgi:hypothetical protein